MADWADGVSAVHVGLDKHSDDGDPPVSKLLGKRVVEEVRAVVFAIAPTKAPGPDGLPGIFYQKFWDKVGPSVTEACLRCLNDSESFACVNKTLICLIPKTKAAERMTNYRPISLCNVLYKVVAKTMANRLRMVLGEVIYEMQNAFIPGRLISDNTIIGFECLHGSEHGSMAVKLDMSKAYDRVEWDFLAHVMLVGLDPDPSEPERTRGSRPEPKPAMIFGSLSRSGSSVTTSNCVEIKRILDVYSLASRQRVNFDKSGRSQDLMSLELFRKGPREEIVKVSQLKNLTGSWNGPLIRELFVKSDAMSILLIPENCSQREDSLCWHYTEDEEYSVKSGYRLGIDLMAKPSTSGDTWSSYYWKKLWNLAVPTKVKILIWRACMNWIPTLGNLTKHKIAVNGCCLICNRDFETITHALWGCKGLKGVRAEFENLTGMKSDVNMTFKDFFFSCLNSVREKCTGVGVVIRDHRGLVMASCSQQLDAIYSTQVAEAVALLRGIDFTMDTGLVPAMIESDGLGKLDKFCFVPRKANFVAHFLAKLALGLDEDLF
ncbi:hypothetical protein Dsin_026907 [Dipteronia sinensis]|uniref:Reverse transcriptase n=1 Tax=Dipteronia sinensis TaxID=43782 RepID=A0AAD9ZZ39_9ROSI|nr:hypothetical protein Dsin_026907 [Dipteronia sinensis]